jgi:hypothetical protein
MRKLPRATTGEPVVISPEVWNRLCDAVERSDNFSVSSPLSMDETPAGRALAIIENRALVPLKIVAPLGSDGMYTVKTGVWKERLSEAGPNSPELTIEFADDVDATAFIPEEVFGGGHALGGDEVVFAHPPPISTDGNRLAYQISFNGFASPQYQGMDMTAVVSGRWGADWDQFIPDFGLA